MRPKAIDVKPLKDYKIEIKFNIEWKNGADICPDELYNNSKTIQ